MSEQVSTDVTVRAALPEDLKRVAAFIAPFVESGKLLPRTLRELEDLKEHLFIAEMEGAIVGTAALEIYSPKLAEVRSLAVDPRTQGHGVGKKLVAACIQVAQEKDVLEVMAITSSDAFFKACGFDWTLPGERKALFYQTRDLE